MQKVIEAFFGHRARMTEAMGAGLAQNPKMGRAASGLAWMASLGSAAGAFLRAPDSRGEPTLVRGWRAFLPVMLTDAAADADSPIRMALVVHETGVDQHGRVGSTLAARALSFDDETALLASLRSLDAMTSGQAQPADLMSAWDLSAGERETLPPALAECLGRHVCVEKGHWVMVNPHGRMRLEDVEIAEDMKDWLRRIGGNPDDVADAAITRSMSMLKSGNKDGLINALLHHRCHELVPQSVLFDWHERLGDEAFLRLAEEGGRIRDGLHDRVRQATSLMKRLVDEASARWAFVMADECSTAPDERVRLVGEIYNALHPDGAGAETIGRNRSQMLECARGLMNPGLAWDPWIAEDRAGRADVAELYRDIGRKIDAGASRVTTMADAWGLSRRTVRALFANAAITPVPMGVMDSAESRVLAEATAKEFWPTGRGWRQWSALCESLAPYLLADEDGPRVLPDMQALVTQPFESLAQTVEDEHDEWQEDRGFDEQLYGFTGAMGAIASYLGHCDRLARDAGIEVPVVLEGVGLRGLSNQSRRLLAGMNGADRLIITRWILGECPDRLLARWPSVARWPGNRDRLETRLGSYEVEEIVDAARLAEVGEEMRNCAVELVGSCVAGGAGVFLFSDSLGRKAIAEVSTKMMIEILQIEGSAHAEAGEGFELAAEALADRLQALYPGSKDIRPDETEAKGFFKAMPDNENLSVMALARRLSPTDRDSVLLPALPRGALRRAASRAFEGLRGPESPERDASGADGNVPDGRSQEP